MTGRRRITKLLTIVALTFLNGASSHAAMTIIDLDGTAPSAGIFLSYTINNTNTKIENDTTDPETGNYKARGQTFLTPDTGVAETEWTVTAITLQSHGTVPTPPSDLVIEIWSWGANANSIGDQGSLLHSFSGAFTAVAAGVAAGDYVTLDFGAPVTLNENTNYAFLLRSAEGGPANNEWLLKIARNQAQNFPAGQMFSHAGSTGLNNSSYSLTISDDLVFFLHGSVVQAPRGTVISIR